MSDRESNPLIEEDLEHVLWQCPRFDSFRLIDIDMLQVVHYWKRMESLYTRSWRNSAVIKLKGEFYYYF